MGGHLPLGKAGADYPSIDCNSISELPLGAVEIPFKSRSESVLPCSN